MVDQRSRGKGAGKVNIPRRAAYFDSERPGGYDPLLRHHIPIQLRAQHSKTSGHKNTTHQILISFVLKGIDTDTVSPFLMNVLLNPRNTRGDSAEPDGKPKYTWLTSFPSILPVFVTLYETVRAVSKRLAGPPGDVCAGNEMTGGADMVAVALPESVGVLFMLPEAVMVPVTLAGAAVDAGLMPDPEALCAAEDEATGMDITGADCLADDTAGLGVAAEAWIASEPEADAAADTPRLPDPLLILKPW
jgi:hypothetical protein